MLENKKEASKFPKKTPKTGIWGWDGMRTKKNGSEEGIRNFGEFLGNFRENLGNFQGNFLGNFRKILGILGISRNF